MPEHNSKAFNVEEGDTVEVCTEDEVLLAEVTEKNRRHPNDPEATWQLDAWTLEADDGEVFKYGVLRDLGGDSHQPLHRYEDGRSEVPEEDILGFVQSVKTLAAP